MESSKQVSFNSSVDIRNIPPRGVGREIKEFKDDFIPGDSVNSALARIAARSSNQKPLSFTPFLQVKPDDISTMNQGQLEGKLRDYTRMLRTMGRTLPDKGEKLRVKIQLYQAGLDRLTRQDQKESVEILVGY